MSRCVLVMCWRLLLTSNCTRSLSLLARAVKSSVVYGFVSFGSSNFVDIQPPGTLSTLSRQDQDFHRRQGKTGKECKPTSVVAFVAFVSVGAVATPLFTGLYRDDRFFDPHRPYQ